MKKMMIGIAFSLSAMGFGQKNADTKNLILYSYESNGCNNKGYFDSRQYKRNEIDDTHKLLYQFTGVQFENHNVFRLSKLDEIRKNKAQYLENLEKQYEQKKKDLYSLKVIDLPIWKKLHQETIQIFEKEYQLKKERILAYIDPASLKSSAFYDHCKDYIEALTSGNPEKKLQVWKSIFEINGEPASQETIAAFNAKVKDSRKDDYALIDLLNTFGNCANSSFRPKADEQEALYTSFDKIFTKLKKDCD
ncbi:MULTISPECIES: hypothetical protein [unclassified Chryseobacterium]|uniref:hypothetical protein n=1 Tax=unclassified Chryseobacterium TaxID=2593645 RepID=UPI000F44E7D1|nr:hypothetical protein [Chryseobacterium sp. G0240]ROI05976.1 hypothetical protein EGI16_03860 [Chryseobacterium sp. G0240]